MSYAIQIVDIAAEMNRATYTTADFERFLRFGQNFLERQYLPKFLELVATGSQTGSAFTLPGVGATGGHIEIVQFQVSDSSGIVIFKPSTERLIRSYRTQGLTPALYWIEAGVLNTAPSYVNSVTYNLTYRIKDAVLSSTNTTNLWDTNAADVLTYAACMAASRFDKDNERLQVYTGFVKEILIDLEREDLRQRAAETSGDSYLYGRG